MKWLRDPMWVFIAIGVLLFWLDSRSAGDDLQIDVSAADVGRLVAQWQAQTGREPTPQELKGLTDQFIEEEVYYREALNYGLANNDTIIRRRLVQKLTFLTEDLATSEQPSAAELEQFYKDRLESYRIPEKYSFQHVYFSRDRRDDAQADASAERARIDATAESPVPAPQGDPFMLQSNFAERSEREVASTFGRRFAAALKDLAPNAWSPPIASAYGHHLVYVHGVAESHIPEFAAITDRVSTDYASELRRAANAEFKEGLLRKYQINRP